MFNSAYKHQNITKRKILYKVIIIVAIIILLVLLIPNLLLYKPNNRKIKTDIKEVAIKNTLKSNLKKLTNASLLYFNEKNIPKKVGKSKKVTLKELEDKKLVTKLKYNNTKCDIDKSYVKITKLDSDYLLKAYLKCGKKKDYILEHVGTFDYCKDTTLCIKEYDEISTLEDDYADSKSEIIKDKKEDDENDSSSNNASEEITEGEAENSITQNNSLWTNYTETDCNNVRQNNFERFTSKRVLVGTLDKTYTAKQLMLVFKGTENLSVCKNYNYFKIRGQLYKTDGNYEEIININKTSTASWTYTGQINVKQTPNFGDHIYYKFAGFDLSRCGEICNDISYIYDVYKYNKKIAKVNTGENCNRDVRQVRNYDVAAKSVFTNRKENVYTTKCYVSRRIFK